MTFASTHNTTQPNITVLSAEETPRALKDTKPHKLEPNTPKFHGNNGEDVEDWIYKIELNLKLANIPNQLWLDHISNYVVGNASVFFDDYANLIDIL